MSCAAKNRKKGFSLFDSIHCIGLLDPFVGQIFVAEARLFAAGVETNSTDAVVDRLVVAVRPVELEFVALCQAGRMILGRFHVADPERIGRIEIFHTVIFDIDLRHAVVGRGQEITVVEADLERARFQLAIPVRCRIRRAKMPLANHGRGIASAFQDRR